MSEHTPGPWKVSIDPDEPEVIAELCTAGLAHFLIVADAYLGDIAADARLVAAAPELLDALIELRDWYSDFTKLPACKANAAIAKATGMQPNAAVVAAPARSERMNRKSPDDSLDAARAAVEQVIADMAVELDRLQSEREVQDAAIACLRADLRECANVRDAELDRLRAALVIAEAALSDIGDADREPGDDVAWCEARAAKALPTVRAALTPNARANARP